MKPVTITPTLKNSNLGSTSSVPKSPLPSTSSSKSYAAPLYSTPKSGKSSTTFGIIWLPGRRNNKKKHQVMNSHSNDHYREKDRAPTMYNFMSGDSQPYKKKEEEGDLLMLDKNKGSATINVSTTMAVADASLDTTGLDNLDDKSLGYMRHEMEDTKEAAGDANEKDSKSDKESIDQDEIINNSSKIKTESEKDTGDKVDSVFLRPQPPGKTQSTASVKEEEDCGINCLYYTLQCCDCVIM